MGHGQPPRAPLGAPRNPLNSILRFIAAHVRGFWGALATFITAGIIAGALAATIFMALAAAVHHGFSQSVDEAVLRWLAARRSAPLDDVMTEITTLGDGVVLIMIVAVTSVFLWLSHHRWSVYILVTGVLGGKILNTALKLGFDRDRPSIVQAITDTSSPSFPSGHAMGAMVAYGSIAYLVSRLEPTPRLRAATWVIAAAIVLLIGFSRMYLGVHYPTDIIAGFLAGLVWVVLVASSVRALQFFAHRRPETSAEERGLHRGAS